LAKEGEKRRAAPRPRPRPAAAPGAKQKPAPEVDGAGVDGAEAGGAEAGGAEAGGAPGPGGTEPSKRGAGDDGKGPAGLSRKELATKYEPYVRSIAGKIKKTLSKDIEFDDLVSYGMLGLMEAADRYDAKYGANFMTFAYYRIRGAIYDGLRGMGWVSRTEYQKYRFEQGANAYLTSMHGAQMAGGAPARGADEEVEELANVVDSLVTIYVTALDAMEGFQVADDGPSLEDSVELQQARALVAEAVQKLPEQERTLLELYYYREMSLEEVGKQLGLSKSWTSRLHARAIDKLGRLLRDLVSEYKPDGLPAPGNKPAGPKRSGAGPPGPKGRNPPAPAADKP
jgi:RNA polymerase sigma factor for flagellar operon FliA